MEYKVGQKIRIIKMDDSNGSDPHASDYDGKEGTITHVDSIGQLHGTWGGLAVIPHLDMIEVIED